MDGEIVRRDRPAFGVAHLLIFLGFYVAFAMLTYLALNAGTPSDRRENAVVAATVGSFSGPFTGAIARRFQTCCWQAAMAVFPYSAALLGLGVLAQIVPFRAGRFERSIRLVLWCAGLAGWFGGGVLVFGHALS